MTNILILLLFYIGDDNNGEGTVILFSNWTLIEQRGVQTSAEKRNMNIQAISLKIYEIVYFVMTRRNFDQKTIFLKSSVIRNTLRLT